jgi:hypothetical protein
MMLLATTVIQKIYITKELVYDTFRKEILGIKKVSPLASSNDATSDSDAKNSYHIGIGV